jgi:hypothetical protein
MAIARYYEINGGLVPISAATALPLLYISTPSTADTNVLRIKVSVEAVSSPAPPSNGSVYFSLNLVTGTKAGGAAATPTKLSASGLASNVTYSAGSTAITGLTPTTEYWGAAVPFTSGAAWEDAYENTGLEIYLPVSSQFAMYVISPSGFSSTCAARAILNTSE